MHINVVFPHKCGAIPSDAIEVVAAAILSFIGLITGHIAILIAHAHFLQLEDVLLLFQGLVKEGKHAVVVLLLLLLGHWGQVTLTLA